MATASQASSLPDPALHLGLVRLQVKRFKACYRWIPADDFYTARRYDPARGTTFATLEFLDGAHGEPMLETFVIYALGKLVGEGRALRAALALRELLAEVDREA